MNPLSHLLRPLGRALKNKRSDPALRLEPWSATLEVPALTLSSPDFVAEGEIPNRHCSMDLGPNVSPELRWSVLPEGTVELLLVMEDPDAPFRVPTLHMAAVFSSAVPFWAQGALIPTTPGVRYLPARFGRTGYFGPRPFPGHGRHRYGFFLFALKASLPPTAESWDTLRAFLAENTLALGTLFGVKVG